MAKVAIIEDDGAIQEMYTLKLGRAGFDVKSASNGVEGLALAEKFKPDIILLDLMMPEMNGDEMLEKMRATPWGKDIKVVVLTNISESEAPDNLEKLDVKYYIVKALHTPTQVVDITKAVAAAKPGESLNMNIA